jgi:hypothetical protein
MLLLRQWSERLVLIGALFYHEITDDPVENGAVIVTGASELCRAYYKQKLE